MLRPPSLFTSCIFVERLANVRLLQRLELGQVQNGQGSNPFGQQITIARAADNSGASNARSTHYIADEIEVHCVSSDGDLSPLGLEELQTPGNIHHEVDFTGAVTPEEQTLHPSSLAFASPQLGKHERFPDGARRWRLTEVSL